MTVHRCHGHNEGIDKVTTVQEGNNLEGCYQSSPAVFAVMERQKEIDGQGNGIESQGNRDQVSRANAI